MAISEAQMKAQRPLGLALSWSWITSVFVIDIGVLALAHRLSAPGRPTAWWLGVAAAALVTIATLLTYRGITVASALARWVWDWSADLWESSPDSGATLSPGCTPGIDHRHRFGRDVVGVRQHQGHLVAVVAIVEAQPPSGLPEGEAAPPATVPVPLIAAGLRQFDVRLDAIDIVSVRKRQDREAADPSASPPVDDHTAGIERGTWLVIRMNPQRNVGAVAARDSVVSTVAAVAERLAGVVDGQRCAARPLTADELAEVDTAVMAGLDPTRTRPGLRHLKHFDGYATSFWVSPWDITSDTLDRLWLLDTDATVVTIRLAAANGRAEVSAWVRYHSSERLGKDVGAGLNHLAGRQLTAVQASLPAPAKRPPLVVPARALDEDDYDLAVRVTPMDAAAPEQPMDPVPQEAMDHTQDSDNARPEPAVATAM